MTPYRKWPTEPQTQRRWLQKIGLGLWLCLASGCGFEPLMGRTDEGAVSNDLRRIGVHVIADRSGQILRNQLLDDLGPGDNSQPPLYMIEVRLSEPRQEIAIRRDESASRISYSANANFTLRNSAGQSVFGGGASSSSTYEATTSEFASIAGQRSARDRAMQEISADIRQQVAAYFFRVRRSLEPTPTAPQRR